MNTYSILKRVKTKNNIITYKENDFKDLDKSINFGCLLLTLLILIFAYALYWIF